MSRRRVSEDDGALAPGALDAPLLTPLARALGRLRHEGGVQEVAGGERGRPQASTSMAKTTCLSCGAVAA